MADNKTSNKKLKGTIKKEVKKTSKKFTIGGIIAIVLCLIIGVVGGIFTEKIITRNDCFVLNGEKQYAIEIGADFTYVEEGYKCISFGKNLTDKVKIETNMTNNGDGTYSIDTSEEGEYYMIYTVESKKFGDIKRVRTFVVGGENE